MLTPKARIVVAAILVAGAISAFVRDQPLWGAVAIVLAMLTLVPVLGTFDLQQAGNAFNAHDREKAWTHLQEIPFRGRLLGRDGRTYYHHLRSLCLQKAEKWDEAAREAEAGVAVAGRSGGAPGVHLAAAQAYAHLGDADAARRHADAARELPHGEAVTRGLARLERTLSPQADTAS